MPEVVRPVPANELERILSLAELDLDYTALTDQLKDLTQLAAKVAGTDLSFINLIDTFTQWTLANYGLELEQTPREGSVCQYTLMENEQFEVKDLSIDERFKDFDYVKDPLALRYYFGVPLKFGKDMNLGSLCVMDSQIKALNPEKIELLKLIANEVVNRIKTYSAISTLKQQKEDATSAKLKVAHDIRGPLAGIIGLSELAATQGKDNNLDDILDFIRLIHKSSKSILELADEILTEDRKVQEPSATALNLRLFKEKLLRLYIPQAQSKAIALQINIQEENREILFPKNKLVQISGNLISNAIKFTPPGGTIVVNLDLAVAAECNVLTISVKDSGAGMSAEVQEKILNGGASSTTGTSGETGYGFGLSLVKHLIDSLGGTLHIDAQPGKGSHFKVELPLKADGTAAV